jgi:hypothetical protein
LRRFDERFHLIEIAPMAGREIIQPHYALLEFEQRLQKIGVNEAGDAGDQPTPLAPRAGRRTLLRSEPLLKAAPFAKRGASPRSMRPRSSTSIGYAEFFVLGVPERARRCRRSNIDEAHMLALIPAIAVRSHGHEKGLVALPHPPGRGLAPIADHLLFACPERERRGPSQFVIHWRRASAPLRARFSIPPLFSVEFNISSTVILFKETTPPMPPTTAMSFAWILAFNEASGGPA